MSKKRVSGAWVDDTPHIYNTSTDTFSTLPHEVIGDGQSNLTWSMDGNMQVNGTPTPQNPIMPAETGEKTANLLDSGSTTYTVLDVMITANNGYYTLNGQSRSGGGRNYHVSKDIMLDSGTYVMKLIGTVEKLTPYIQNGTTIIGYDRYPFTLNEPTSVYLGFNFDNSKPNFDNVSFGVMLIQSSTAPTTFEPYGYKIPISFGQNTYNIYISEPLRKSLDGSNVYDTIESNGTLTRRVDENGDALATPTTEQVTVPTLTTTGTPEQFNVLTTLAPSEVSLTYHGWHEHSDTKYSNP